jgi:Carbohydrate binding domain/SdiA-regulated
MAHRRTTLYRMGGHGGGWGYDGPLVPSALVLPGRGVNLARVLVALITVALVGGLLPGAAIARYEGFVSTAEPASEARVATGYLRLDRVIEPEELGVAVPGRIAWDARSGVFVVEDRRTPGRASAVSPLGRVLGTRSAPALVGARNVAGDPATGHTFVLDLAAGQLLELGTSGNTISIRSVEELGLISVQGMVIAPSGDQTDDPDATSLFISDAGTTSEGSIVGAGLYEVSLTEPLLASSVAAATVNDGTLVQTIDTSSWNPASPDPSGMAYVPIDDRLVVTDGEVEEVTGAGWHNANVWFATRSGTVLSTMDVTTAVKPNKEPVGAAYDSSTNQLYLSKDSSPGKVWIYQRQADGSFVQIHYFELRSSVADAEGLAFDPVSQTLFIADGTSKEVWKQNRGPDNTFGTADDVVSSFDTLALGQPDPEGIEFDEVTGNLWIVSNSTTASLLEVTPAGVPVSTTSLSFIPGLNSPAGLTVATSSTGTGRSIWICDRGVDNGSNPNENDGRIYEVTLVEGEPPPPPPPPPPPGSNVITNGGFEDASGSGSPTGWSTNTSFTRSAVQVHGGTYAGLHQSSSDAGYTITQDAPVVGGTAYAFSAWVNAPPTTDKFKIVFKIQWRASGKISVVTLGKFTKATNGWTVMTGNVTAPAGATTARVMMVIGSLNASIYVDDMSLATGP